MIGRRAAAAGIGTKIGNHTFRATGITAYLKNGGALETAAAMANHSSTRTTQLYDRWRDEMSLDEVITSLVGAVAEVRGQIPEAIDYRGPAENLRTAWLAVRSNLRLTLEGITIADIVAGDLSRIADPSAAPAVSQAPAVVGARARRSIPLPPS